MNKKSRANFLYRIGQVDDQKVLLIWDQNLGNMSVTNDMENVVADIALHNAVDPSEYLIIYRDSEGRWDGWDVSTGEFFVIGKEVLTMLGQALTFDFETPKSLSNG